MHEAAIVHKMHEKLCRVVHRKEGRDCTRERQCAQTILLVERFDGGRLVRKKRGARRERSNIGTRYVIECSCRPDEIVDCRGGQDSVE